MKELDIIRKEMLNNHITITTELRKGTESLKLLKKRLEVEMTSDNNCSEWKRCFSLVFELIEEFGG